MAASFQNWADSWGNSWGSVVTDPNAMYGSASFTISGALQVAQGQMQGAASFAISASLTLQEPPRNWIAEVELRRPARRWYVRKGKRVILFDTPEQADAFIAADQPAKKKKARKQATIVIQAPAQTVDLDATTAMVERLSMPVDMPALIVQQDWARIVQIMEIAQEMQDEEDCVELLLLA